MGDSTGSIELRDLVQREDVILCELVPHSLRSGIIKQGHLMLSRERGIQHFQKLVYRFRRLPKMIGFDASRNSRELKSVSEIVPQV